MKISTKLADALATAITARDLDKISMDVITDTDAEALADLRARGLEEYLKDLKTPVHIECSDGESEPDQAQLDTFNKALKQKAEALRAIVQGTLGGDKVAASVLPKHVTSFYASRGTYQYLDYDRLWVSDVEGCPLFGNPKYGRIQSIGLLKIFIFFPAVYGEFVVESCAHGRHASVTIALTPAANPELPVSTGQKRAADKGIAALAAFYDEHMDNANRKEDVAQVVLGALALVDSDEEIELQSYRIIMNGYFLKPSNSYVNNLSKHAAALSAIAEGQRRFPEVCEALFAGKRKLQQLKDAMNDTGLIPVLLAKYGADSIPGELAAACCKT